MDRTTWQVIDPVIPSTTSYKLAGAREMRQCCCLSSSLSWTAHGTLSKGSLLLAVSPMLLFQHGGGGQMPSSTKSGRDWSFPLFTSLFHDYLIVFFQQLCSKKGGEKLIFDGRPTKILLKYHQVKQTLWWQGATEKSLSWISTRFLTKWKLFSAKWP